MSEWRKIAIGELVTLRQGFAINVKSKHYISKEQTSLALLRIADMKSGSREIFVKEDIPQNFIAKPQDIIYTRTGNVGLVFRNNYGVVHNNCFTVTPKDECILSRDFLYYLLQSHYFFEKANSLARGAAQPDLPHTLFNSIEISYPNLDTQHRIATILSRYDSLIENYQKQIKLLEESAQRLYKEWFVDLRFPGHENTKIVDGVPEGWEKKSVADVLEIKYGKDHKLLKDGTNPVYGTGGVMRYVEKSLCTGESVLIPRKGSLNNILLVDGTFWTIDTMFYSIPKEDNVAKIVYFYLKGVDMYSFNIGAAVPSMTVNILSGIKLLIPQDDIRKEFEKIVSIYFIRMQSLQSQIRHLTEARDRMLPKLMSGEIEV